MLFSAEWGEGIISQRVTMMVFFTGNKYVLVFSSWSSSLSCCRRSLAHLANSSWLLVAVSSRRTRRYSACVLRCSAAALAVGTGRKLRSVHSYNGCGAWLAFRDAGAIVTLERRKHTRLLMTEAPIRLMMCTATSTAKTMTRRDVISACVYSVDARRPGGWRALCRDAGGEAVVVGRSSSTYVV